MPCKHIAFSNGVRAIVCTPNARRARCASCGVLSSDYRLCDWKIGDGKTCDAKVCLSCRHSVAPDKDLCREHATLWKSHPANRARAA